MWAYIAKRLLLSIPVILGVAFVVFAMVRVIPGDPAQIMAGEAATEEFVEAVRKDLGLDRPLLTQFASFVGNALRGDFGRSIRSKAPVTIELRARIPNTISLTIAGLVVAVAVGVSAGVISAIRPYSLMDAAVMLVALAGLSMPVFWSGLMLILVFAVWLGWLPAVGTGTPLHLILPAVTLGMATAAIIAINRHAFRNALIPVITVVGLQMGTLLSGAVLTESVFAWPGIGRLLVEGILTRDYPLVQASVLVVALAFVLVNIFVDLLYAVVDPRIHYE